MKLDRPFRELLAHLPQNQIQLLNITPDHLAEVSIMPLHHHDPFDRLISAQSIRETMPIVGADAAFDDYGIMRHW